MTSTTAHPEPPPEDRLTWFDIARLTGIRVPSLRAIHYRSQKNRKQAFLEGNPSLIKPGDLPEPDGYQPQEKGRPLPYWHRPTYEEWIKRKRPKSL